MVHEITTIEQTLEGLSGWEDRLRYLASLGQALPPLTANERVDRNKVQGCVSQVWIVSHVESENDAPKVHYRAQSDAQVMQGMVAVLLAIYSGRPAADIANTDALEILDRLGLREHLSKQHSNGLVAMVKKIRADAGVAAIGLRYRVLQHIGNHETENMGSRVPDTWIEEANASIADGQSIKDGTGRRLTEAGRLLVSLSIAQPLMAGSDF